MTKQNFVLLSKLSKNQKQKAKTLVAKYCRYGEIRNFAIEGCVIRFTYKHSMKICLLRNYGKGYFLVDKMTYSTFI